MMHVDALSRDIAYVNALPLEWELEFRQLSDPKISEISKELEYNSSDKFELIDGLVYKKEENDLKFVVPESMVINLFKTHHDEMAHPGAEKTLQGIKHNFWFPKMRIVDYATS